MRRQTKSYYYTKKSSDPLNLPMTPKFSNKGSSMTPKNYGLAETLILALIYNESLARGEVPDELQQANVSPVFKKGEKYDAANYRPVSLTCICCKTLEHILVSNINKHLALDSILADCQHGFRSQRSCETQLVQFVHDIISNLDGAVNRGHKQTDLIIMDFAKAFDKVPHRRLLHKLEYYGIRGSTHKWINRAAASIRVLGYSRIWIKNRVWIFVTAEIVGSRSFFFLQKQEVFHKMVDWKFSLTTVLIDISHLNTFVSCR